MREIRSYTFYSDSGVKITTQSLIKMLKNIEGSYLTWDIAHLSLVNDVITPYIKIYYYEKEVE